MSRRTSLLLLSIAVGFGLAAIPREAEAQVTGSIFGVVRDASGGVLPGATVTATSTALKRESQSTVTNGVGAHSLEPPPRGRVLGTIRASGFGPAPS